MLRDQVSYKLSTCLRPPTDDDNSLANAELYMTLAGVFRSFEFELYRTDISDVELAHDFFLPSPKMDSKGVRVKVKADSKETGRVRA
jgi:hypothetical protein